MGSSCLSSLYHQLWSISAWWSSWPHRMSERTLDGSSRTQWGGVTLAAYGVRCWVVEPKKYKFRVSVKLSTCNPTTGFFSLCVFKLIIWTNKPVKTHYLNRTLLYSKCSQQKMSTLLLCNIITVICNKDWQSSMQHHFVDIDHQVKFRLARFSCKNLQRHLQVCPASMTLAQSSASKPSCVLDNPKIRINAFTSKFLH